MAKRGGWQLRFVLVTVVLGGAAWAANEVWEVNDSPQRLCLKARWDARGGWDEAAAKLKMTHQRLIRDRSSKATAGRAQEDHSSTRWRMWQSAHEMAELALAHVYSKPEKAREAAIEASQACREARESSPTVGSTTVGSTGGGRRYTPGGGAVRACAKAAEKSEEAWDACSYEVPGQFTGTATSIDIGFNFFRGCD